MARWSDRLAPRIISRVKLARARQLRQEATLAEARAWQLLRNRRMLGLKFKRQCVFAGFIVDFYCAELKLVLELDGSQHRDQHQASYDEARTKLLEARGLRIVRIHNEDLSPIMLRSLLERLSSRPPSPRMGEGDRG